MMRQRRAGHLQPPLDVVNALALGPGAHQQPEDPQAILLAQGAELFDPPVHYDISNIIELSSDATGWTRFSGYRVGDAGSGCWSLSDFRAAVAPKARIKSSSEYSSAHLSTELHLTGYL